MQNYLFNLNEIVGEVLLELGLLLAEVCILPLHNALHRFGLFFGVVKGLIHFARELGSFQAVVFQTSLHRLNFIGLDVLQGHG